MPGRSGNRPFARLVRHFGGKLVSQELVFSLSPSHFDSSLRFVTSIRHFDSLT